ncbi:MAG: hypothetical protein ACREDN_07310 [Aestuariivirga sp.]
MTGEIRKEDIEAAVAAGVIEESAADRLLNFIQSKGGGRASNADEENLRLISSFNDIFVTIGLALFLGAIAVIGNAYNVSAGAFAVAAASWLLAEVFTRRKRMAFPSIILLVTFGASAFLGVSAWLTPDVEDAFSKNLNAFAIAGIATAALIGLHWLRFRVPITIAAGCAALAIAVISFAMVNMPEWFRAHPAAIFLPLGLAVFALAMAFDMTDRQRLTRRTDIAFWLHLLAAPMIVHPIVSEWTPLYDQTPAHSGVILALFATLSIVALITDRRALLVSSLGYLIYAAYALISAASQAYGAAPAVLAVGSIVLILSVAWRPPRRFVLKFVPAPVLARVPEPA